MEDFRKDNPEASEETEEVADQLRCSVVLIGQALNKINHARRIAALSAVPQVADYKVAEVTVKTNAECFVNEKKSLFGKQFSESLKVDSKATNKLAEALEIKSRSKKNKRNKKKHNDRQQGNRAPFRSGQSSRGPYQSRGSSGGHSNHSGSGQQQGRPIWNSFSQYSSQNKQHGGQRGKSSLPTTGGAVQSTPCCFRDSLKGHHLRSTPKRRESKVVLEELASSHPGPIDFKPSKGVEDSLPEETPPIPHPKRDPTKRPGDSSSGHRDRKHAPEGGNLQIQNGRKPVHQWHFCASKKGRTIQANHKSKTSKQRHRVRSLQDGQLVGHQAPLKKGRCDDKTRFSRCILERGDPPRVSEIPQVSVEGESLSVYGPSLWAGTSPKAVYETSKSSDLHSKTPQHQDHHIPGRHADHLQQCPGSPQRQGHCDYPFIKPRAHNKLGQILFDSIAMLRVSGNDNIKQRPYNRPSQGESERASEIMSIFTKGRINNTKEAGQGHRETLCHLPSSVDSSSPTERAPTRPDCIPKSGTRLRGHSDPIQGSSSRSEMVVKKLKTHKGKPTDNGTPRNILVFRRIKNSGLGSPYERWKVHRGSMVPKRKGTPHQCPGTDGGRDRHQNIHPRPPSSVSTHRNRQPGGPILSGKKGRNQKYDSQPDCQEDLGLPLGQPNKPHSKLDPFGSQQTGRSNVTSEAELKRMDARSQNIPTNSSNLGAPINRLLCISNNETNAKVHESLPRPRLRSLKRHVSKLEGRVSIPFSSILHDREGPQETEVSGNSTSNSSGPSLARPNLVPNASGSVYRHSQTNPKLSKPSTKQLGKKSSSGREPQPQFGGIQNYRNSLKSQGFSEGAIHLLVNSRKRSTAQTYSSPWNQWSAWCDKWNLDPYSAPIEKCADYLAELFEKGFQARTIGVARSAISAYHHPIDGKKIGEHPVLSNIMKGVNTLRPPHPRYCVIWDVDDVLNYLKTLNNESLSLKLLTYKTAMLTALAAASRGGEIRLLNSSLMGITMNKISFFFDTHLKHSKPSKPIKPLEFFRFQENETICPVLTLNYYMDKTKTFREKNKIKQVFIKTKKPHTPVCSATVARWVKKVLEECGIDTSVFKGHSVRAASSSKAGSRGATLKDILDRGNWSQESTWQRFYNHEIISAGERFQRAVLMGNKTL